MYLRNCWYVAAWDHEVGSALFPVKVLGEGIVLYRKTDGGVAAPEDACPYRKLPRSMGRIKGDDVECGYHGLTFDRTGTCTRVPGARENPACGEGPALSDRRTLWAAPDLDGRAGKSGPGIDLSGRPLGRRGLGGQPRRLDGDRSQLPVHDRQSA
jgi:phenylpropionate dioxygenase-like ring-hydroxylating dioxygenase large terminal subunit